MGMLINNEKQSLMDAPLCEHRHTLFLTFKIHTRCCVGMCECVCARHFKAATWPHVISNFEQLGVWLHGGTTNSRTHAENRKHLNRKHRGHHSPSSGRRTRGSSSSSSFTADILTEDRGVVASLNSAHTDTHIHRQDRSGNPQSINTPKTSQL